MSTHTTDAKAPDEVSVADLRTRLKGLEVSCTELWALVKVDDKHARIAAIDTELAKGWDEVKDAVALQRERTRLDAAMRPLATTRAKVAELVDLLELAAEENDPDLLTDIDSQLATLEGEVRRLEVDRYLSHPHAAEDSYLDIQFGSGGTESQDWVRMLKRMYVGYANLNSWDAKVIEETPGDHGIKSVTLEISGRNAFGMLRTESGIHRLVRRSPFDSNNRRHTTFASVYAYPVLPDNDDEVAINPADLRIDTYRSSGAGGQHVNTTDSAVRITHLPTGVVVQCQNDRSQHSNRTKAMSMLRSRLAMLREEEERARQAAEEAAKPDITWGQQIRNYVLDQSRVKDLRTGVEAGMPQAVLDGDLRRFIDASLRQGV